MYERFYGLLRQPFAVTPDPSLLYMSRVHREALATIVYGIETRKGFIVCTGEVGTGKTTIVRAIFDQAASESFEIIYSFAPQISPLEMATYICRELEEDDPPSVFAALPRLQWKLLEIFESGRTVVLMIDEAQLLPPETLEFLRLLSNFETDREKLIQTVLVGQPELDNTLARRDMRQVNQRVALRARLAPLSLNESIEYIEHRLLASGAENPTQILSPGAAWRIVEAAHGIPRAINILADNVLIAGLGAGQQPIGAWLADSAIREFVGKSGAASPVRRQSRLRRWRTRRLARSRRHDTASAAALGFTR
jgi:general secretion pathway protein A